MNRQSTQHPDFSIADSKHASMKPRTCVTPSGFLVGVHNPGYTVTNLRCTDRVQSLGRDEDDLDVCNQRNFPETDVDVEQAARIYEIPNALLFRGTTYIDSSWADAKARDPASICLPRPAPCSLRAWLAKYAHAWQGRGAVEQEDMIRELPEPLLLALAATSTDAEDLRILAALSCEILFDAVSGEPTGLRYSRGDHGRGGPKIHRRDLFETLVNNPRLPDAYKRVMVLRPGAQGGSEIVGDFEAEAGRTRIYEYLRRNSYIPFGHYAANMADDAVRYAIGDLFVEDMQGLRHLYYQRTYVRLAAELGLRIPAREGLDAKALEALRLRIVDAMAVARGKGKRLMYSGTLWGWNFGFDFAPSGYRLHASHQQVHQQYALVPGAAFTFPGAKNSESAFASFACGDLVAETGKRYQETYGQNFFQDYEQALRENSRTDGRDGPSSLIVYEDDQVLLFAPKAQTSGFELQLMPARPVGNILEADAACRAALDKGMLLAQKILERLGVRLVTSIEYSRRFDTADTDQRLLYAFLPKLPYAPGGFSEAQSRFIVGHYPEDFAAACRKAWSD